MTAASLEELRGELERLRRRARLQIAQALRDARSFGEGSNNDEYHAVREEQMVLEAQLAALEQTIERATIAGPDEAAPGAAVIGSTVSIEDLTSGTTARYRLTSAHQSLGPDLISAASPVGQALIGAMPGATVTVDLPNGRSRSMRLVAVETGPSATGPAGGPAWPM
jgi:transcription elongation factor GreA